VVSVVVVQAATETLGRMVWLAATVQEVLAAVVVPLRQTHLILLLVVMVATDTFV
jgi:hypothetical protein